MDRKDRVSYLCSYLKGIRRDCPLMASLPIKFVLIFNANLSFCSSLEQVQQLAYSQINANVKERREEREK